MLQTTQIDSGLASCELATPTGAIPEKDHYRLVVVKMLSEQIRVSFTQTGIGPLTTYRTEMVYRRGGLTEWNKQIFGVDTERIILSATG